LIIISSISQGVPGWQMSLWPVCQLLSVFQYPHSGTVSFLVSVVVDMVVDDYKCRESIAASHLFL
jgi:hypothetical protein